MTARALLRIRFLGWWHAGTGETGAADADMIALRDHFGCPALPMTQVKGTLREAADRFWAPAKVERYFGQSTARRDAGSEAIAVSATQGAIRFSGLMTISPDEGAWFAQPENHDVRGHLFGLLYATAIDEKTGTASAKSLRQIEAAVPMTLQAEISLCDHPPEADWIGEIDKLCALAPAFGKLKNDGYGRAIASCDPCEQQR